MTVSLVGFYATRKWVRRIHGAEHSHNEIVGFYLGAVCLFYGITLGLVAVGTWEVYSDVDNKVGEEASALSALYRDVSSYPDPKRAELQADLREYARKVIDVAWPLQRRGIVPQNSADALMAIQTHLAGFEPVSEGQKTLHAEAYHYAQDEPEAGAVVCERRVGQCRHGGHRLFRRPRRIFITTYSIMVTLIVLAQII